ncbi:MAG: ankyrin repeat domain-containing protein [Bacillota bacterium]
MDRQEAIVAAVRAKESAQVEALLQEEPALIQTRTPEGSLILTALYLGAHEVLAVLLRHNPPLDIFEAAAMGNEERILALLATDPQLVHAANADGFHPLHLAAFFGHASAVRALLEGGAEVNRIMASRVPYVPSNTALHAAISGGPHREVVELLVTAGANPNLRDSNGHTPVQSAAFHKATEIIAYLKAHGATDEVE